MRIEIKEDGRISVDSVKPMSLFEFAEKILKQLDAMGVEFYDKGTGEPIDMQRMEERNE